MNRYNFSKNLTSSSEKLNHEKTRDSTISFSFKEVEAARIIERCWCSYRDRQMFKLLKHTICAAEHSVSNEILRKIVPLETNILNDPCLKVKVKFRFSGNEFPPFIVFKIYTQLQDGRAAKYMNGKNTITSSATAAQEACSQMGNKKYLNLMILDNLQSHANKKVTEQIDIISIRDYMQYTSLIDNLPAYMGGRSNNWRRLNLTDLNRNTVFYDIINYVMTKKMTKNLAKEMPILLKAPVTQEIQVQQMLALAKIDQQIDSSKNISNAYLNNSILKTGSSQISSRRSKNAVSNVSRMKKNFVMARSETLNTEMELTNNSNPRSESFKLPDELNDDFEDEVKNLYMWTQNLSVNDDFVNSPRWQPKS